MFGSSAASTQNIIFPAALLVQYSTQFDKASTANTDETLTTLHHRPRTRVNTCRMPAVSVRAELTSRDG